MGFEFLTNVPLAASREDYVAMLQANGFGHQTEVIPVYEACVFQGAIYYTSNENQTW